VRQGAPAVQCRKRSLEHRRHESCAGRVRARRDMGTPAEVQRSRYALGRIHENDARYSAPRSRTPRRAPDRMRRSRARAAGVRVGSRIVPGFPLAASRFAPDRERAKEDGAAKKHSTGKHGRSSGQRTFRVGKSSIASSSTSSPTAFMHISPSHARERPRRRRRRRAPKRASRSRSRARLRSAAQRSSNPHACTTTRSPSCAACWLMPLRGATHAVARARPHRRVCPGGANGA
jgi:hypothetical protein